MNSKIHENRCKQKILTNPGNRCFILYIIYCSIADSKIDENRCKQTLASLP